MKRNSSNHYKEEETKTVILGIDEFLYWQERLLGTEDDIPSFEHRGITYISMNHNMNLLMSYD